MLKEKTKKEMNIKKQMRFNDKYCTIFTGKQISAVKKYFNISKSKRVFAFGLWCGRYYFLCEDKVYVVRFDYVDNDIYKPIVNCACVITLKNGNIFNFEGINDDNALNFKLWYKTPVRVNEFVDVAHGEAIKFLQNYNKKTFNSGRYLFYAKRDNDLTWLYFIYAYDTKTNAELKIYVDDCYINTIFPKKLNQIYVKDLSGKLSNYQILQCKKAFFEYCKKPCKELNAPNFYALEFVKQCIQPIEKDRGWLVAKPLCEETVDFEIWIDDVLMYDEKPYFLVRNKEKTKIAAFDFYKPEYKSTNPYISGCAKFLHWDLDKETLEKLTNFLCKKFNYKNTIYCKKYGGKDSSNKARTNWQQIIETYNDNTASYKEYYIKLPLDLEIPDYTKLKV